MYDFYNIINDPLLNSRNIKDKKSYDEYKKKYAELAQKFCPSNLNNYDNTNDIIPYDGNRDDVIEKLTNYLPEKYEDFLQYKDYLRRYVQEKDNRQDVTSAIYDYLDLKPSVTMTVYRGQKNDREILTNYGGREIKWFSTTIDESVASEHFIEKDGDDNCCVFKIHLINIPVIYVNQDLYDCPSEDITNQHENMKFWEHEIIVKGGGTFYKDEDLNEEGFLDLGNGKLEAWYKIKRPYWEDPDAYGYGGSKIRARKTRKVRKHRKVKSKMLRKTKIKKSKKMNKKKKNPHKKSHKKHNEH
jgi:hypothetical protein